MVDIKKKAGFISKIKEKGKDLVSIISESFKRPTSEAVKGFLIGTGYDNVLYALSHYIKELAHSSPMYVPGYVSTGIHWDDVIFLTTTGLIAAHGLYKKNSKRALLGLSMLPGGFITSQFQYGPL